MKNIYDFIEDEINDYDKDVELEDGWAWNMPAHLRRSFLYKNSQFEEENDDRDLRPNKNIILPIMNIQYRTEGFDVTDIQLYADNPDERDKSFLINKFHDKWAIENGIDTFIDDVVVSYCDYGGTLARNTDEAKPEVIDLRSLAFCSRVDILSAPFGIKHVFTPTDLRKMDKWGKPENGATITTEELITIVEKEDKKEINVIEVHGELPGEWITEDESEEDAPKDIPQIQIVAFYKDQESNQKWVTLFRKKEPELPFKFLARDKVIGRALGRGGIEELFEPQIWTNWNEVKITEMLDSASKTLHQTSDPTFKARNNLGSADNNEVLMLQDGKDIKPVDTFPRNLIVFNDSMTRWQEQAQIIASAADPLLGGEPAPRTPFKLFEAQQMESRSMHKYRQGQIAVFFDEIYRDWVLPHLGREIAKEQNFMSLLSGDEMQEVVDRMAVRRTNGFKKAMILGLKEVNEDLARAFEQRVREDFTKEGSKRFFKILKEEMKNVSIAVSTDIAGKQKNLGMVTDKLVSVLRQYIASPEIRQDPEMTKLLNTILESSGMSPVTFGAVPLAQPAQQPAPQVAPTQ